MLAIVFSLENPARQTANTTNDNNKVLANILFLIPASFFKVMYYVNYYFIPIMILYQKHRFL